MCSLKPPALRRSEAQFCVSTREVFISENTTGFPSELTVFTDPEGRDWCVAVVKATFTVGDKGAVTVAQEQAELVFADEHYGEAGESSTRYESDFAPEKKFVDVLVNGHVYAPGGRPVPQCQAALRVGAISKILRVSGRRFWTQGLRIGASRPTPFDKVALVYENAFGGVDMSHDAVKHQGAELRNPLGCGYRKSPKDGDAMGHAVPQLEYASDPPIAFKKPKPPASLGVVGRGWQPRIGFAGTYGDAWLEHTAPFLPRDFDMRYFQTAPADQQLPSLPAGTMVQLAYLTPNGAFIFSIPEVTIPIVYRFADREERPILRMDTLLIEPDARRFMMTWRCKLALGRKLGDLREIKVGKPSVVKSDSGLRYRNGKPYFRNLAELVRWRKRGGR